MQPIYKVTIALIVGLLIMAFTIVKVRKSNLNGDTKALLYIIAVVAPIVGMVLFFIMSRRKNKA